MHANYLFKIRINKNLIDNINYIENYFDENYGSHSLDENNWYHHLMVVSSDNKAYNLSKTEHWRGFHHFFDEFTDKMGNEINNAYEYMIKYAAKCALVDLNFSYSDNVNLELKKLDDRIDSMPLSDAITMNSLIPIRDAMINDYKSNYGSPEGEISVYNLEALFRLTNVLKSGDFPFSRNGYTPYQYRAFDIIDYDYNGDYSRKENDNPNLIDAILVTDIHT